MEEGVYAQRKKRSEELKRIAEEARRKGSFILPRKVKKKG